MVSYVNRSVQKNYRDDQTANLTGKTLHLLAYDDPFFNVHSVV